MIQILASIILLVASLVMIGTGISSINILRLTRQYYPPITDFRITKLEINKKSYKASTIVIYDSKVIPDLKIPHITTVDC